MCVYEGTFGRASAYVVITLEKGKDDGIAALEVVFGFHVTQPAEERSSNQSVSIELLVVLVSVKSSNLTWVVP